MASLENRVGLGNVHDAQIREHDAEQRSALPRERPQLERRFRPCGGRRQEYEREGRRGRDVHARLQVLSVNRCEG